ncbi:MAG: ABC transporter ATP-binding protein [Ruminococcus sp.]|nr:ABC transporter ATP-binding protein [Ruminococcus sp.]MCR5075082.1 ABC transporter ATP-binding protein [Ruminococcus sp.]
MELLKIENLCKTYGKGENEVKALNNVSFTVPKGQMLAVIGPSGSGKSTLLHILGGVDRPTSGKVFLDGQDVYAQNDRDLAVFRRRQVGLIYQFYNLIPVLDAEENITLPMVMDGRKPDKKHLEDLLELLQLKERRHHLPSQLSGGQQQRVSIGRALFTSPGVILADEPTGNLDRKNSAEIIKLLRQSNRDLEQTMIIITHDENIALQCDRIITISDGQIVGDKINDIK